MNVTLIYTFLTFLLPATLTSCKSVTHDSVSMQLTWLNILVYTLKQLNYLPRTFFLHLLLAVICDTCNVWHCIY